MNYLSKVKLSTVEEALDVKFQTNIISIGFDTAVYHTGIAIVRTTDHYLIVERLHKIEVPKNFSDLDKIDLFLSQLDDFKHQVSSKYKFDINTVEDCFFGRNVVTLKALARYGILVYDHFRDICKQSKLELPNTARKKINFKKSDKKIKGVKLKKEIIEYMNNALNLTITNSDEADALVLALSGGVI